MKSKKDLIEELNQVVQTTGTLTVLHTNAIANKVGVSATEFEAMDVINRCQPMNAGHLARRCGLTTGAITGIVDRLERAGFVKRKTDPADRRKVLLEPIHDPKKYQKLHELYQPIAQAFDELMSTYTTEQIQFLIDVHRAMNERVEQIIAQMQEPSR